LTDLGQAALILWCRPKDSKPPDPRRHHDARRPPAKPSHWPSTNRPSSEGLLHGVASTDNGGKGAVFEQRDAGDLTVVVDHTKTGNNDDSDKTGLKVVQDGDGEGTLTIRASEIADGIDAENGNIIEE